MKIFAAHRDEFRDLLRLGLPMVATQFFIMAMGFLDTAMAGHYSSVDLAGVALGGNILWPVFMLMSGLTMALTPIVAQLRGAAAVDQAGSKIRQGLWVALFASFVCVAVIINAEPIFVLSGVDAEAAAIGVRYLRAAAWGIPPVLLYVTLRYTSEGLGKTLPPMLIAGAALPLNGLLNYMFIYGKFGAPQLGGEGCGWATAIVMWFELILICLLLRSSYFRATKVLAHFEPPRIDEILRILKIGLPIGLTVFVEMAFFSVVGLMIGSLGVTSLAAHSIAGNVNWATYVIPMAFGSAASIRVGYFVGANDFERSRHVAKTAFFMSLCYALAISVVLILSRQHIVTAYTQDPAVLTMAASLLLFIAVYQIVDDTQATMVGALRGYKDTRMPMVFALVGFWFLALPLGAALAFGWFDLPAYGVAGFWFAMTLGLAIVAVCVGLRLVSTSRNDSRIERFARI